MITQLAAARLDLRPVINRPLVFAPLTAAPAAAADDPLAARCGTLTDPDASAVLGHGVFVRDDVMRLGLFDLWRSGERALTLGRVGTPGPDHVFTLERALGWPPQAASDTPFSERQPIPSTLPRGWIESVGRFLPQAANAPQRSAPGAPAVSLRLAVGLERGLAAQAQQQLRRLAKGAFDHGLGAGLLARLIVATIELALRASNATATVRCAGHVELPAQWARPQGYSPSTDWLLDRAQGWLAAHDPLGLLASCRKSAAHALLLIGDFGIRPAVPSNAAESRSALVGAATISGLTPAVTRRREELEFAPAAAPCAKQWFVQPVALADFAASLLAYAAAHEFGHLCGAGHDRETFDTGARAVRSWARAAVIRTGDDCWQTLMGNQAVAGPRHLLARRLPLFSTPRDCGLGFAVGSENENNAQIVDTLAPVLADYRF